MATTLFQAPKLFIFTRQCNHDVQRIAASCIMKMDSKPARVGQRDEVSVPVKLQFGRLQTLEKDDRYEFGQFIAREASLDEEKWTAAWLRAESHWEDRLNDRFAETFKRKFVEQEFNAIKTRRNTQNCKCIVTVKKEEPNLRRTVIKSMVGTLDWSIRYLMQGETFPKERVNAPLFWQPSRTGPSRYGYIANLCVSKSSRRQGVATNMMYFALQSAKTTGVEMVYVHVDRQNPAAQQMYNKIGFEIVEEATLQLEEENTYLLCIEVQKL